MRRSSRISAEEEKKQRNVRQRVSNARTLRALNRQGVQPRTLTEVNTWIRRARPGDRLRIPNLDLGMLRRLQLPTLRSHRGLMLSMSGAELNLNMYTMPEINRRVEENLFNIEQGNYPDEILRMLSNGVGDLELVVYNTTPAPSNNGRRSRMSFFPYLNCMGTQIDLSRYGVYTRLQEVESEVEHCLVKALRLSGQLDEHEIHVVQSSVGNRPFPRNGFNRLADQLNLRILLRTDKSTGTKYYGSKEAARTISLGQVEDHVFLNEPTVYTRRHVELKDQWERPQQVEDYRFLNSLKLILTMKELNRFEPCLFSEEAFASRLDAHLKVTEDRLLVSEPTDMCFGEVKATEHSVYSTVGYFDIETDTQSRTYHTPYAVGWCLELPHSEVNFLMIQEEEDIHTLGRQFLEKVFAEMFYHFGRTHMTLLMYAHNASYDLQLLFSCCRTSKMLRKQQWVKSWNGIFTTTGVYGSNRGTLSITVHDSYQMIPEKLAKFPNIFKLPAEKEFYPYDHYTISHIVENVSYPWEHVPEDMRETLTSLQDEHGDVACYALAEHYCKMDVWLLQQGVQIFRRWMKEVTGLYLDDYITLSHLAKNYMIRCGVFEGVFTVTRHVMEFIRKTVVGGRTMTNSNRVFVTDTALDDQDVNSLYPTAMTRMPGFLKGKARVIPTDIRTSQPVFLQWMTAVDGIFAKIRIDHVGQTREFPTLYYREDEVLHWSNDMEGRFMYVCKTTLEDLLSYHQIQFTVVEGYYYNEGFNTNIRQCMKTLYEKRKEKKRENNPIERAYKLIMNSCYGVTLTKPIGNNIKIVLREKFEEYYARNHLYILQTYSMGSPYGHKEREEVAVELVKTLAENSCLPHVGSEILAWSKRHMNEIMYLAEDLGVMIYYGDTDSMQVDRRTFPLVVTAYEAKFQQVLIGKELGQISSEWAEGVYSEKAYFAGKKMYCNVLTDGSFYFRMKGVTKDAVLNECRLSSRTVSEVYEHICQGGVVTFHNGYKANGDRAVRFKREAGGGYTQMEECYLIKKIQIKS